MVKIKDKRAFMKIVEAFIAIMLIMAAVLMIISRSSPEENREELTQTGERILKFISEDENLMSQALMNNTEGINKTIAQLVPATINFYVNICYYNSVCPNNNADSLRKYVYSTQILIPGNLTLSNPKTKLKLFFWEKG